VEQKEKIKEARFISNSSLFMKNISSTFHGRDIMAPVAAAIAKGLPGKKIGPVFSGYRRLPFPLPAKAGNKITGQVIAIDHFGNAITNIRRNYLSAKSVFNISDRMLKDLKLTYASVPPGEVLALIGSFGFLEFSVRNGSFAGAFNVKIGSAVEAIVSLE
ncbi:MAG: SAM-dependent chlorinase/fluorinase, partial [Elusimicrobiota bacterium]